ncbi:aminopeptidase P family N-terminal domain-containing protein, partial [Mycolicibacterium sp. CBMA 361]
MTISHRRHILSRHLAAAELDAILVTDLVNVHYLSGFTGSNAALLIPSEQDKDGETAILATDGRYRTQAAQQAPDLQIVIERTCAPQLVRAAAAAGMKRLGFES